MKSTIITAILLVIAIAAGYVYFSQKDTGSSVFDIKGRWKIDSIKTNPSDSLTVNASFSKENFQSIEFAADSICKFIEAKDSLSAKYYLKDSILMIKADSLFEPFQLKITSPKTVQLLTKDSLSLFLNKE